MKKYYSTFGKIKKIAELFRNTLSSNGLILFLFVLVVFFSELNPRFICFLNLQFILKQSAILLIASMGGAFIILIGSIDLSTGGVASLACLASALLVRYNSFYFSPFWTTVIVLLEAMAIGAIFGMANGLILVKGKIPSFLITLGTGTIAGGLALILSGGFTIPIFLHTYKHLASGNIFNIPILAIIAAIIYIYAIFLANYTPFGRYCYAVGGGEQAARYSGVNVDKIKLLTFTLAGILNGLSGGLLAARLGAGTYGSGSSLTLDVIAAVVMSGASLSGGVGKVSKIVLGVLAITLLSNGLNIIGVNPHVQIVIKGIIVIVVVYAATDRSQISIVK